ncbi:YceI family protein [Seonamhaeicola marinus]|uniref:YceI family protein n=1 Tax=Seonamhaeicola marinus TaxID=1912246 RepID=A0A5D0H6L7_9FLAO|nr:YceI family protein [Seonamhaeicola marinus]TYA65999.1 YceI family protein [Seonamhaeicola marinus]
MKKGVLSICAIAILSISALSCKEKAKEAETKEAETATVAEATTEKLNVTVSESSIAWKGFKPGGSHNGTINISNGSLDVTDNKVSGGAFTIDMASIVVLDIPAEEKGNAKLSGHLKSADFFDVEAYPNATFEITGLSEAEGKTMLSGNLKLKDATNNITFPVTVATVNDTLTLTSETFTIDRSKWNVKYKSKSFFEDLGDKFINDDIELAVSVKAVK